MDEHLRQALEIVKAQASFRTMTEDEISSMVRNLAIAIQKMMSGSVAEEAAPSAQGNPGKFLKEKSISCLECGKSFKIITKKHLMSHGMTPDEYRDKWGYPKDLPLVCKALQRDRRNKMKDMKLWEKRRKNA